MKDTSIWKVRAVDLRRMAARAVEPERQRKMLALADHFEENGVELEFRVEGRDPRPEG